MEQRLSDYLLDQIAHVNRYGMDGVNPASKGDQVAQFYLERIAKEIIAGREAFTDEEFAIWEKCLQNEPEITEAEVDRVLSLRVLEDVPAMVNRLVSLSKLTAARIPSGQTAVYISEAARAYVYGLTQASAAMSRAALEQALKENLGRQGDGSFISFQELVEDAKKWNILDGITAKQVRDLAKKADLVLHERPIDLNGARDVLIEVRGLLQEIYSVSGKF